MQYFFFVTSIRMFKSILLPVFLFVWFFFFVLAKYQFFKKSPAVVAEWPSPRVFLCVTWNSCPKSPLHLVDNQTQPGKLSIYWGLFSPKLHRIDLIISNLCIWRQVACRSTGLSRAEFSLSDPFLRSWLHHLMEWRGIIVPLTSSVHRQVPHREAETSYQP